MYDKNLGKLVWSVPTYIYNSLGMGVVQRQQKYNVGCLLGFENDKEKKCHC